MKNAYTLLFAFVFVFSFVILSPVSVKADYTVETNTATTPLYTLSTGEYTNTAQEFTTIGDASVTSGEVCLYKSGTPSGTITLSVYQISSLNPTGTVLGYSDPVNVSSLPSSSGAAARVSFTFSTPLELSGSSTYITVLSRTATDSAVVVCGQESTSPVVRLSSNNGTSWSAGVHQQNQIIYLQEGTPPIPTPTSTPLVASSSVLIIDPNRDFAFGMFMFLIGFLGMIYIFKKR